MTSVGEHDEMTPNGYVDGAADNASQRRHSAAAALSSDDEDRLATMATATVDRVRARIFKVIVIGDANVGKTCLTFRFCGGKFPAMTEATIGVDFRERTVNVDGDLVKLQLWDTAGTERYHKGLANHFYRNLHAVIFVYDVTKMSSFNSLHQWLAEYDRHRPDGAAHVPRILVGNKCDCDVDSAASGCRVPTQVAQRFADSHGMPLFETSAKDDNEANHVDAIFLTLAHKLRHSRPMMWSTQPASSSGSSRKRDVPGRRSYGGIITVHKDTDQQLCESSAAPRSSGCC